MYKLLDARRVLVAIMALGLFAMATRAITDPDVWWHLRTGQLILHNHAVFQADLYSFTRAGQPWINHEWLADLFMFGLYLAGGTAALTIAFAGIAAGAFLLVFARSPGKPYVAGVVTVWGACASAPSWGARPQIISLLLASFFLWILERSEGNAKLLLWTFPLTVLWVNLHAEFAVGIALIALFILGDFLDASFGFAPWEKVAPRLRRLSLVLAGCVAVVPLNPYGARMYLYPWQTLSSPAMGAYIQEWASPDFHRQMYLPFLLMVLALTAAAAITPVQLGARKLLLLTVTLCAGLNSVRHIPLFALVAAPILAALMQAIFDERGLHLPRREARPATLKLLLNLAMLAGVAVFAALWVHSVVQHQVRSETKQFPVRAISFLTAQKPSGPLFNSYNWGGYLIWKVYPSYRVFVDGRADLYGDEFLNDLASIYFVQDQWQRKFEPWRIRLVLLPPDAPLVTALRLQPGWQQIYADEQAVVLARKD